MERPCEFSAVLTVVGSEKLKNWVIELAFRESRNRHSADDGTKWHGKKVPPAIAKRQWGDYSRLLSEVERSPGY
jgi:hypothetical protein